MTYIYSTKPEGIKFYCSATCINDGVNISISTEEMASSHREAADQFEEYLNGSHEGFDFRVSILTDDEKKPKR